MLDLSTVTLFPATKLPCFWIWHTWGFCLGQLPDHVPITISAGGLWGMFIEQNGTKPRVVFNERFPESDTLATITLGDATSRYYEVRSRCALDADARRLTIIS